VVCFRIIDGFFAAMAGRTRQFRRIMLKVSGEALGGEDGRGIDPQTLQRVSGEIAQLAKSGKEVAVVMGAGNFFRGVTGIAGGMDQVTSDQMGMLATLMNALALRDAIVAAGVGAVVLSAIEIGPVAEPYSPHRGREVLGRGEVALCAAGTGNPFFTTDTAAALRALELGCDVMFKASKVDGVYDKDPARHPEAVRFETMTYNDVLSAKLGIMDLTAITLAESGGLPIVVFNLREKGAMVRIAAGEVGLGTLITAG